MSYVNYIIEKKDKNKNKTKNGFKKFSNKLMFEYSNLRFLSIFKEIKSLLSSNIPWASGGINYIFEFPFRN